MRRLDTYGRVSRCSKAIAAVLLLAAPSGAQAVETHLLALGDSLTQGYGLLEQDGFVPQLRAWLAARGHDVRVVNGGVSGDTTAGGLARVEWSLGPEIEGMIVALGGNDLLRGIDPATVRANLRGILEVAQARDVEVLLIGMDAPGNYGPEYKQAFDAIFEELAAEFGALYLDSFFAGIMTEAEAPSEMAAFLQSDGIHPNADGVARIVSAVGPQVEALIERTRD